MQLLSLIFKNTTYKQIFLKNTFWMTFSAIVSRLLKFFLIPFAAKVFGPNDFGILAYTYSFIVLFFMLSDFGIGTLFIRESQKEEVKTDYLSTMLWCKLFLIGIGFLAALLGYFVIKDPLVLSIYFIYLGLGLVNQIKTVLSDICSSIFKTEYFSISNIIESVFISILGFLVLFIKPTLVYFALVYFFGSTLNLIFLFFFIRKSLFKFNSFNIKHIKNILLRSLPFLATAIIGTLLIVSDNLMIKWIRGAEEVGYYQAAFKLFGLATLFTGFISHSFFPLLSKVYNQKETFLIMLRQGLSVLIMLALPIFIGGILLGDLFIEEIFSSTYNQSAVAFKILISSVLFLFPLKLLNTCLLAINHQVKNMKISMLASLLNIVANLILIPIFGFIGAAIGTLISRIFDVTVTYLFCKKILGNVSFFHYASLFRYFIASILMGAVILICQLLHVYFLVIIGIGFIVYCVTLITMKDIHFLRLFSLLKKHI
jgi:O-antigen/teichoic acid export membrane protein